MPEQQRVRRWRRLDHAGLEILHWREHEHGIEAVSTIIDAGPDPFALHYTWNLDQDWRTRDIVLLRSDGDDRTLRVERTGDTAWRVNGEPRPDLDGCLEIDISATPLCNSLAIRALGREDGALTALYIDALNDLNLRPSAQRYERLGPRKFRYVDMGVVEGFEAVLELDSEGLVLSYEDLFEALR